MEQPREPLKWETDAVFEDAESRLAIRVSRAEASSKTLFNTELGRISEDGRFARYFGPKLSSVNWQVKAEFPDFSVYNKLKIKVVEHVETILQRRNDEILAKKQAKEQADLDRNKPKLRPGLKQLGKR